MIYLGAPIETPERQHRCESFRVPCHWDRAVPFAQLIAFAGSGSSYVAAELSLNAGSLPAPSLPLNYSGTKSISSGTAFSISHLR